MKTICLTKLYFRVCQRPKLLALPGPCGKQQNLSTNIIKLFTQLIVHLLYDVVLLHYPPFLSCQM